jgi:cobalt/nickel transport system permease protein
MTHMHIPDGILPVGLWVLGLIVMVLAVGFSLFRLRGMNMAKKIPLLVVAGILLGPALGFLAAFIANLILALMGHGGITVIGLNTLLLGSEAVLGHTLFYLFKKRLPVFWRAAVATVLTLFMTTVALIGIVAVSHIDPELVRHGDEHGLVRSGQASVQTFAFMVLSLGVIGWSIEAAITGAVVRFISQVKPDLLDHALHREKDDK